MTYTSTHYVECPLIVEGITLSYVECLVEVSFTPGHAGFFDHVTGDADPPSGPDVEILNMWFEDADDGRRIEAPEPYRTMFTSWIEANYLDELTDNAGDNYYEDTYHE